MQRKRGELVPIGDALADLDGPVKELREISPQAMHHYTCFDQVNQLIEAREADADLGFNGAAAGAVLPAPHQPRRPDPVQARQRPLHALGMRAKVRSRRIVGGEARRDPLVCLWQRAYIQHRKRAYIWMLQEERCDSPEKHIECAHLCARLEVGGQDTKEDGTNPLRLAQ